MIVALLERMWLLTTYGPVSYGDTGSYFRSAEVLARGTLNGYDGTRVPGYPFFIAMLGLDPHRVWLGQMGLGLGITLLLYLWTLRATSSPAAAFVVGTLYNLIPGQFLFEANLLTETLTTFLVLLSLYLAMVARGQESAWRSATLGFAGGLAAGAAGLARILFYPLAVWLLPYVAVGRRSWRERLLAALTWSIPPALLLGGWIAWVHASYGFLAPTTMGGYNLVQHTGVFFEYLPDEYAPLRDTYLRYRNARIAERGDQTNTIWDAIPELSRVTGLGFYDLSRELGRASILLIRGHPDLYARNVVEGWIDFWKAPVYWDPGAMESTGGRRLLELGSIAGRWVSLAANAAYLLWMAALAIPHEVTRRLRRDADWMWTAGLVAFSSVLQTVSDHGDNPRFLVPLQMVVMMLVVVALVRLSQWWTQTRRNGE
jgi:uncharacterized membrane protein YtjA (UPF0391 family)